MISLDRVFFFDIETIAADDASDFVGVISAPANWKDPEKIAAYIAEKEQSAVEKAALDPDIGRLVAINWQYFNQERFSETHTLLDVTHEEEASDGTGKIAVYKSEKEILYSFYDAVLKSGKAYLCGYNITDFDLPYIRRRAMALNVVPSIPIFERDNNILDLMKILYGWRGQSKGLKFVANRYKLENGAPDVDGSQVARIFADKDRDTLVQYVESDVDLLVQLFHRMNYIYF